jgi:site-specific recombinase XerD
MDFHAATVDFLADRKRRGCMASTLFAYSQLLRWFTSFLASRQIQDSACISVEDIAAYVESMQVAPRPLSAVTIHRRLTTLRVFLRWLVDEGALPSIVIRRAAWPKKPDRLPKALNHKQASQLLSAPMHVRDRAIVALLLDTGIREAECCSLDVSDLDLEGGTLLVRKGKGAKQRLVIFEGETRRLLSDWLAVRVSAEPALFVSLHANKTTVKGVRLEENGLYSAVKRAADSVGLGKTVTPHGLRHSFATMYLDNGGKIEDVSDLLGHSDISTTMGYVRITRAKLQRAHANVSPMNRLKAEG